MIPIELKNKKKQVLTLVAIGLSLRPFGIRIVGMQVEQLLLMRETNCRSKHFRAITIKSMISSPSEVIHFSLHPVREPDNGLEQWNYRK
jgi:hypothetical protein